MRWIVITLTALIVAGAGAWWLLGRLKQTEASDQGTYVSVQRRDLVATVTATGKVTAMVGAEVRVGSRVSGRVQRLHANI
ncbi:MAG: efflux RND transporter periplasmic adaptor subunit, partial [Acidobacteria bacterium]|nr:efflux RND transporter periplasmic adaptor subunit [Acidobacteriota bacterium]